MSIDAVRRVMPLICGLHDPWCSPYGTHGWACARCRTPIRVNTNVEMHLRGLGGAVRDHLRGLLVSRRPGLRPEPVSRACRPRSAVMTGFIQPNPLRNRDKVCVSAHDVTTTNEKGAL